VLFSRKQRSQHAREKRDADSLSLPALLDALNDVEAFDYGRAKGLVDDDDDDAEAGGVSLAIRTRDLMDLS
jgi:hypothetical protein